MSLEISPNPLEKLLKRYWQVDEFRFIGRYEVHPSGKIAFFNDLRTSTGDLLYFPEDKVTGLKSKAGSASLIANEKLRVGEYYQFTAILNPRESELGRNPLFVLPQPFGKVSGQVQMRIQKEKLIKDIFKRNGATPYDAQNLANSLKNFQIELYTKTERFIFELLQNADDFPIEGNDVSITFEVLDENVLVLHNGRPFSSRDVESICSIGNSSKAKDVSATGYKGIGFKSVFTHAKRVFISSGGYNFCFNKEHSTYLQFEKMFPDYRENFTDDKSKYVGSESIPWQLKPIWRERHLFSDEVRKRDDFFNRNVSFCLEFGQDNCKQFLEKATSFFRDPRFLLFLRNIQKVTLMSGNDQLVVEREVHDNEATLSSDGVVQKYTIYSTENIDFTGERETFEKEPDIPQKLKEFPYLTLSFAALVNDENIEADVDAPLFTYLPTEDTAYGFPFLVNGDFVTTSNREQILPGNKWNALVFQQIGFHLFKWIQHIIQTSDYHKNSYDLIPKKLDGATRVVAAFNAGFEKALAEVEFILNRNGQMQLLADTLIDNTGFSDLLGEDFFEITGITKTPIDISISRKRIEALIYSSELGEVFEFEDLKDLCSERKLDYWLSAPGNNSAFLKHLYQKNWIDRLSDLPIFLNQNEKLCKKNDLYDDLADDLKLLEWLPLSYLHPEVASSLEGTLLPIRSYRPSNFILESILGNKVPVDSLLSVKENSLNFYRYVFKHRKQLTEGEFFGQNNLNYFKVWGTKGYIGDFNERIYAYEQELGNLVEKYVFPDEQFYLLSSEFSESPNDEGEWKKFWERFGVRRFDKSTFSEFLSSEIIEHIAEQKKYFDYYDYFEEDAEPTESFLAKRDANIALWSFVSNALIHIPSSEKNTIIKKLGQLVVFSTDHCTTAELKNCYLSENYTGDPTLEQLADRYEDIESHFVSGCYAESNEGLSKNDWKQLFSACGAQTTTANFAERLSIQLGDIDDTNLVNTTVFLFANKKIFDGDYQRLHSLRIKVKNGFLAPSEAILGPHYTGNSIIDSVLPSIQLSNFVGNEYSDTRLGDWKSFFENAGVTILRTEQEVIDYKINWWLKKQDELNTPEINLSIVVELVTLHKENKIKDQYELLSQLKLLVKGSDNEYLAARECHLSTEYKPKLDLESILVEDEKPDIFVSPLYIIGNMEDLRGLLRKIGVESNLEIIEERSVPRSRLSVAYLSTMEQKNPYIKENARTFASQHQITPWISLNYEKYLSNAHVLLAFWTRVQENQKFKDCLSRKVAYKCAFNSFSHINNLAFLVLNKEYLLNGLNQPTRAQDIYSIRFEGVIDDPLLLPGIDLTKIFIDGVVLEEWLGVRQELSLSLCLQRISQVNDFLQLQSEGIWDRIKVIFDSKKKSLSSEDHASLNYFIENGNLPNQLGNWIRTSELFYISDGFELGIGNSGWLISNELNSIGSEFGLNELTKGDFKPEYRNSVPDTEFLARFATKVKLIAFAETPNDWRDLKMKYLEVIKEYNFIRVSRISVCYSKVAPPIENTERNFYSDNKNIYFIGSWNGARAVTLFSFLRDVLSLKKISEKVLQDILLNSDSDIVDFFIERNLPVPEDWIGVRNTVRQEPYEQIVEKMSDSISKAHQGNEIINSINDKNIRDLSESGGRDSVERRLDNEEAKEISLDWLKSNGFDCSGHKIDFDKITNIRKISDGQIFTVLVSSIRGGKLFLRPIKWLEIGTANTFLLAVSSERNVKLFSNTQEILDAYVRTIMRVKNDKVTADDMNTIADFNSETETMQFVFYNAEDKYDEDFEQIQRFKALDVEIIDSESYEDSDILD